MPDSPTTQVRGRVDRVDNDAVEGWLTLIEAPERKLSIDVMLDGDILGRCIADLYRKDLEDAGFADGYCAFKLKMPELLPGTQLNDIKVRISGSPAFLITPLQVGFNAPVTASPAPPVAAAPNEAPPVQMLAGEVELVATAFVSGWAQTGRENLHLCAKLHGAVIGVGLADRARPDLPYEPDKGLPGRRGFFILFDRLLQPDQLDGVVVEAIGTGAGIARWSARKDQLPACQLFILGSPRSGTSELGRTLATQLELPWFGECHAAPLFARAASAMAGDPENESLFLRYLATEGFRKRIAQMARFAYFDMHRSASFIDKTPGAPMINSAPFLQEIFPTAKFIYLQRNGISNVLSRLTKFGGDFVGHCGDWVAAVSNWAQVKPQLSNFLELRQEDMLNAPDEVADKLAAYLDVPDKKAGIAASMRTGTSERTGAGLNRTTLAETGWSNERIRIFKQLCGVAMDRTGYKM